MTHPALAVLKGYRFRTTSERELQDGIGQALTAAGISFEREKRLSAYDRPDFFIDGLVIEVKCKGTWRAGLSQAMRYSEHGDVTEVALIGTCRWLDMRGMPQKVSGKPLHFLKLRGAFL